VVQFNANQGQEWTSFRTTAQEGDFQVSRRGKIGMQMQWERERGGLIAKRDHKGDCEHVL
jgi:hypothetical protein